MKKLVVAAVGLILVGLVLMWVGLGWSGIATPAQEAGYKIVKVEATDGALADLTKSVFGNENARWYRVLPRGWMLVQHEWKGKVIPHTIKHIMVPLSWMRGAYTEARATRRYHPYLYLFGSRVEDQINPVTGTVWRPFFRGVTKAGSVIAGLSLRRMNPTELRAVVRVIGTEITVITFD